MDSTLQRLAALEDIRNLKAEYCRLIDAAVNSPGPQVAASLGALFADDIVADYGAHGSVRGRDALVSFLCETVPAQWEWAWHSVLTPQIAIDGDHAAGSWVVYCRGRLRGAQTARVILGRFEDAYRFDGQTWRQTRLKLIDESDQLDVTSAPMVEPA